MMKRKILAMLLVVCMCIGYTSFSVAAASYTEAESASFITRSDGIWFWPLPQSTYNTFTDWAGCNGNSSCMFHPGNNHGGCVPSHATSNGYGHNGIDVGVVVGTSVYASADGTLYCTSTDWAYRGITAVVEHPLGTDSNGIEWSYYTIYQHLKSVVSSLDQKEVKVGDLIAYSGKTDGFGTGAAHLHFAILLAESGKGYNMSRNPSKYISAVENKGWLQSEGYTEGRIMNNPALNSPAGYPAGHTSVVPNLIDHAGSVMYTFEKSEVAIGSGYLAKCKSYPSYGTIIATAKTNAMSLPCSSGTNADSVVLENVSSGDKYVTTALLYNTAGNYWYKVQTSKGETAYIPASKMKHDSTYVSDIKITDVSAPSSLKVGDYFSIKGKISATYNKLTTVSAYVHKGMDIYGDIVTGGSDSVSGNSYSLYNSAVDMKVLFNNLPAGQYTYAVYVQYDNWYATSEKEKTNSGGFNYCIYSCTFVVGSSGNACNHSYKTTWSTDSNSHWHECPLCGAKKDIAPHTYDNACDVGCNICGYSRTVSHSYSEAVTDPTCTEQGYTTYTCTKCGNSYVDNYVAQTEHEPGYAQEVIVATCTEGGLLSYFCAYCNTHYLTEATKPVGHIYGEWYVTDTSTERRNCINCSHYETRSTSCDHSYTAVETAPTCSQQGYTTYTCTQCGDSYTGNTVNALEHDYQIFETKAPTCAEQGYTMYACTRCGNFYFSDYVDPTDHEPGYAQEEITATCTEGGLLYYFCAYCNAHYLTEATKPVGHIYGEWYTTDTSTERRNCINCSHYETRSTSCDHSYTSVETAPTCSQQGYTTYTCTKCGDSYVGDYVDIIGHQYGDWYPVTSPADTARRDCLFCSHYETISTACQHSYVATVTAPTCTEQGYTTFTCDLCDSSYTDNYVSPAGHKWGDWFEAEAPTCTESGIKRSNCQNCNSACITTETAPLGHNYQSSITAPTCTTQGYTSETCVNCRDRYDHSVVPAKGHQMGSWYIVKPATNTADGYEQKDCANCAHHETRIIPALASPGGSPQPADPTNPSAETPSRNSTVLFIVIGGICAAALLGIGIAIGKRKQ